MRIAAILTCHNRRDKTLACLAALYACDRPPETVVQVFLTDDGSTDGTAGAVRERYPNVRLLSGDGSLFWNGGMRWAFAVAMKEDYDAYLWLNDDSVIARNTLRELIITWKRESECEGKDSIIVGSMKDPSSGELTYGGWYRPVRWRMSFERVRPQIGAVECETMNGNCVLIPATVVRAVGNLDPEFVHSIGDFDYGLRARKAGFRVLVMPGYAGTCSRNSVVGTFDDKGLPFLQRLQKMAQPKGLPMRSWRVYTRRHGGPFWFAFWVWPYLKVIAASITKR